MEQKQNKAIEDLKTNLNELRLKISEYRKAGYDTFNAELMVFNIPSKIQMVEITHNVEDIKKIKLIYKKIIDELKETKVDFTNQDIKEKRLYEKIERSKEEYLEEHSESLIIKRAKKLIKDAYDAIENKDYKESLLNYTELRDIYKYLPKQLKIPIYKETINIYQSIIKSGIAKAEVEKDESSNFRRSEGFFNIFKKLFKK